MATITVDVDRLRVRFETREKWLGLVRDYEVPVSSVAGAREVRTWREDVRGLRVGLGLPRRLLLGTWYSRGHRQLVALRWQQPAVYVVLRGEKYDELLVEAPDPEAVLARLPRLAG